MAAAVCLAGIAINRGEPINSIWLVLASVSSFTLMPVKKKWNRSGMNSSDSATSSNGERSRCNARSWNSVLKRMNWMPVCRNTSVRGTRAKAATVVDAELSRLAGRLSEEGVSGHALEEIAQTVRRVVDKLLHAPTVRVKELASSPDGEEYAAALRVLFDLDPRTVDAVTRAEVESPVTSNLEGNQ